MANNANNAGNKTVQTITGITKDTLGRIIRNLNTTLWLGFAAGTVGIIGYSIGPSPISRFKLFFILALLAAASYICGFFLGFLFGIPKRNNNNESDYNLSTNLVDISDWLTKIIIGLGLIEIKKIPGYLLSIGTYIQQTISGENSVKIFSICCIVYFSVFGLYYGYNYMRLFLSGQFKEADDNLLINKQKLSETGEALKEQNIDPTSEIDESMKKNLNTYSELLKSTKTEDDYTFEDWYYKGISSYDNKNYNQCITYMQNALAKDAKAKNAPDAHLYIGICYDAISLKEKAMEQYDYIINNYRSYEYMYIVYYDKGLVLNNLGRFDEALELFNIALNMAPDFPNAWADKGNSLISLGKNEEALQALDKALILDPNYPTASFNKCVALYNLKRYEEAMQSIEKVLLLDSKDEEAWNYKGAILLKLGRLDEAVATFDTTIKLKPDYGSPWYNKAAVFALKNEKEKMLLNLQKAIELNRGFTDTAKADEDFASFYSDEDFKKLVGVA